MCVYDVQKKDELEAQVEQILAEIPTVSASSATETAADDVSHAKQDTAITESSV